MKLLGVKMSIKNIIIIILIVVGSVSLLKMLGVINPKVEFMSGGGGDHSDHTHNFNEPTFANLE